MDWTIIQSIGDIMSGARARDRKKTEDFLEFFHQVVTNVSSETARAFGNMSVKLVKGNTIEGAGIELTVSDYFWWKQKLQDQDIRFDRNITDVRMDMIQHLATKVERVDMTAEERQSLMKLLEDAENQSASN